MPYVCLRCGYVSDRKSSLRKHLNTLKPCPTTRNGITRELLISNLDRPDEVNNRTCEKCNITFATYAAYTYHVINSVCNNQNRFQSNLEIEREREREISNDNDAVIFGEESYSHITQNVIIETFGEQWFDPDVIKHIYFNSEQPLNQNIIELQTGDIAIKKRHGWESRPWSSVVHTILQRMILQLLSRSDINSIADIDENFKSQIDHWRNFIKQNASRSDQYKRVVNDIRHVIHVYSVTSKQNQIQNQLNRSL